MKTIEKPIIAELTDGGVKLKAGDVRKAGDEMRRDMPDYASMYGSDHCEREGEWRSVPTGMLGWPILKIDLFGATYRRRAPVPQGVATSFQA